MLFKTVFAFIAFIFIVVNSETQSTSKWITNAITDLEEQNMREILFICNDNDQDQKLMEIISNFKKRIPSIFTDFKNFESNNRSIIMIQNQINEKLIIIIEIYKNGFDTSKILEITTMVTNLTALKTRPKCLVLHLYDKKQWPKYTKLLHQTWEDLYLDFTIIEMYSPLVNETDQKTQILHYLNPFSGKHIKQKYSTNIKLFPNKLQDMKRYPLKVGSFHRPPYAIVRRNSTGHPISTDGSDVRISKIFSDVLNFRMTLVPNSKEEYGIFNCDRSKSTGLTYQMLHNLLQFVNVRSVHVSAACSDKADDFVLFGLVHYYVAVPINTETNYYFSMGWNVTITVLATGLLVLLLFVTSKLFKFTNRIWIFTNTLRAFLGLTMPENPSELKERILFGTMLLASIFYTNFFFAAITDVHFQKEVEIFVSSLEELSESNLEVFVPENTFNLIQKSGDISVIEMLEKKKFQKSVIEEECLKMLAGQTQVACIGRRRIIQRWINTYRNLQGRPIIKLIPSTLFSTTEGYLIQSGLPYVKKFNRLMNRLHASGIFSKLENDYSRESIKEIEKDSNESSALDVLFLLFLLIIGYSTSIIAFVFENLYQYVKVFFDHY